MRIKKDLPGVNSRQGGLFRHRTEFRRVPMFSITLPERRVRASATTTAGQGRGVAGEGDGGSGEGVGDDHGGPGQGA